MAPAHVLSCQFRVFAVTPPPYLWPLQRCALLQTAQPSLHGTLASPPSTAKFKQRRQILLTWLETHTGKNMKILTTTVQTIQWLVYVIRIVTKWYEINRTPFANYSYHVTFDWSIQDETSCHAWGLSTQILLHLQVLGTSYTRTSRSLFAHSPMHNKRLILFRLWWCRACTRKHSVRWLRLLLDLRGVCTWQGLKLYNGHRTWPAAWIIILSLPWQT